MNIEFADIAKYINAEQDVIDAIDKHLQQHNVLINACELVERAYVGDGVDMSLAVDACLLALENLNS